MAKAKSKKIQEQDQPQLAYLKAEFGETETRDGSTAPPQRVVYKKLILPSKLHMDHAIMNWAHQCGLKKIETVTEEEYESNTQIQS